MNPTESSRFRFIVRSAEEAVTVLREQLGPRARVVSVKQVEGKGLARFLRAPNLEVIAEVAPETPATPTTPATPAAKAETPAPVTAPVATQSSVQAPAAEFVLPEPVAETPPPAPIAPRASAPTLTPHIFPTAESGFARLLRAGGISAPIIARMQNDAVWQSWQSLPPAEAFTQVGMSLRDQWQVRQPRALGQRAAFIGSPGAGKTTALCKQLASDIFVRRRRAVVLKLDLENVNPDDGLVVFCEALGVPFAREIDEVPDLAPDESLYIDVPGVITRDASQTAKLREVLEAVGTTGRVLVMNAAYDAEILKQSRAWGDSLGCTHTAFTHLDEILHWAKLWDFVLPPAATPLFLSTGQSIAGDLEENVFDAVLSHTFPTASAAIPIAA